MNDKESEEFKEFLEQSEKLNKFLLYHIVMIKFMPDKDTLEEYLNDRHEVEVSMTDEYYQKFVCAYKAMCDEDSEDWERDVMMTLCEYYDQIKDRVYEELED